jgi:hypothetical protein
MRGKMLWFNDRKDLGFVRTDDGERLAVPGAAFASGQRPTGRCAEAVVEFEIDDAAEERCAKDVVFVEEEAPRRARMRGHGIRSR